MAKRSQVNRGLPLFWQAFFHPVPASGRFIMRRDILKTGLAGLGAAVVPGLAVAQKRYGPGADDKEIKIGGISPYSGPASSYGTIGKGIKAYFDKINAEGGINGRKLNFISYDDGYNPSRTVEMARKLVEQDEVLFLFNVLGTPTNSAIHKYMNQQKVPQLFNATGATKWGDPKAYPWTIGWQPSYQSEAFIYAQHILDTKPNAKIGIIYQNDDYGRDYLKGFEDGLGDKAKTMIVKNDRQSDGRPQGLRR
ncbi:MAG: ABC transporter substrate-binding protein [Burkholderiales bacterium]|nr:ABC transporter substrate-binding protein [Burkholderiales bacterium]